MPFPLIQQDCFHKKRGTIPWSKYTLSKKTSCSQGLKFHKNWLSKHSAPGAGTHRVLGGTAREQMWHPLSGVSLPHRVKDALQHRAPASPQGWPHNHPGDTETSQAQQTHWCKGCTTTVPFLALWFIHLILWIQPWCQTLQSSKAKALKAKTP